MSPPVQRRLVPLVVSAAVLFLVSVLWMARPAGEGGIPAGPGPLPHPVGSPSSSSRMKGAEGADGNGPGVASDLLLKVPQSNSTAFHVRDRAGWPNRDAAAEAPAAPDPAALSSAASGGSGLDARDFEALDTRHQDMVMRLLTGENEDALRTAEGDVLLPEVCFAAGTRPEIVRSFTAARRLAESRRVAGKVAATATQLGSRWTRTATVPSGSQGDPTTLTWSIVPDGTTIPPGSGGEEASPSNLRAWLDARYGSESDWLPLFTQVFQRWSELSGISYVHEPNDDGAGFPNSAGMLGIRGDIRLSGHPIDGNFNILGYNYFPQQGDMVLDTDDSFFADTSNNSQKLRTVVAHEHGHGLALRHVCPSNATKLMEPFIASAVASPKLDDIYSVQRLYGDRFEPNNTTAASRDLGTLPVGKTTLGDLSIDDNGEIDFLHFAPPHDGSLLSVTLRPVGASYLEGGQDSDGTCSAGTTFNSLTRYNLDVELRDADGTTILIAANSEPAGEEEAFSIFPLPAGSGPFFLRVFPSAPASNRVQLYELELTLVDATTPRVLSVADVSVNEGVGTATLTVSVVPSALESIEVPWQPAGDTATAGVDFPVPGGTAVIPPGAASTTITVPIFDDALDEDDETFSVQLVAPTNAVVADGSAMVTISDDDPLPTLTVVSGSAGEALGQSVSFLATLSAPSGRQVRVDWATATLASTPTPAQPDQDYVPASGTLTLAAGETSGVIGPVTVIDDALAEPDETFDLNLTGPVHVTLAVPTVSGRIDDDDAPLALSQTGSFAAPDAEGHPVIAWEGVIGRRYRVETSSDLMTWTPLPGNSTLTAIQTALSFADTSTDVSPRRYYRVLDLPP